MCRCSCSIWSAGISSAVSTPPRAAANLAPSDAGSRAGTRTGSKLRALTARTGGFRCSHKRLAYQSPSTVDEAGATPIGFWCKRRSSVCVHLRTTIVPEDSRAGRVELLARECGRAASSAGPAARAGRDLLAARHQPGDEWLRSPLSPDAPHPSCATTAERFSRIPSPGFRRCPPSRIQSRGVLPLSRPRRGPFLAVSLDCLFPSFFRPLPLFPFNSPDVLGPQNHLSLLSLLSSSKLATPPPPFMVTFIPAPTPPSRSLGGRGRGRCRSDRRPHRRGRGGQLFRADPGACALETHQLPHQQSGSRPSTRADDFPDEARDEFADDPDDDLPDDFRRLDAGAHQPSCSRPIAMLNVHTRG